MILDDSLTLKEYKELIDLLEWKKSSDRLIELSLKNSMTEKYMIDEEIIGPFLQVTRVNSFEEAIIKANDSCYGLAAGIITEDKSLYNLFESKIEAGIIALNKQLTGASKYAPFGGIKDSGNYRPSGFLSADYSVYSTASVEIEQVPDNIKIPTGINL